MTGGGAPFPMRWVSLAERAWDENAVWKACIDLLDHEAIESLSPEQRVAHLAFHAERRIREHGLSAFRDSTPRALVDETAQALERIGALEHARLLRSNDLADRSGEFAWLAPSIESRLRAYLDAYEPYFVGVARPNCTA